MNTKTPLAEIDPLELMSIAPELVIWRSGLVDTEDEVAQFMFHGGPISPRMSAASAHGEDALLCLHWTAATISYEARVYK